MGARVRVIGPSTLMPAREIDQMGVEVFTSMEEGLRVRRGDDAAAAARTHGQALVPSVREYFHHYGLDAAKLAWPSPTRW
jgi:aspartate carbamoyltransferase catalytic subunit